MQLHRFNVQQLPLTSWKNGGGATREIACWPTEAGLDDFDWRVSIATITTSGPFSVFPGVDRTIMLLEGDGVRLRAGDMDHRLDEPLVPFEFSGDLAVSCTLLGGGSSDFNVMSRRSRGRAKVRVWEGSGTFDAAPVALVLCLAGRWQAAGQSLSAGDGFWWTGFSARESPPLLDALEPNARLVTVDWFAASETNPSIRASPPL